VIIIVLTAVLSATRRRLTRLEARVNVYLQDQHIKNERFAHHLDLHTFAARFGETRTQGKR
jgi:hypothetical protein